MTRGCCYTRLTAPGEGGIGKLLIWGDEPLGLVAPLFHGQRALDQPGLYHGQLMRAEELLDEVLLELPEDPPPQVSLSAHGGELSLLRIESALRELGLQAAEYPVYLRWAAKHGGLDRPRAEARLALQAARTERALEVALAQEAGAFSAALQQILEGAEVAERVAELWRAVPFGRALFAPARLALVGPTNVGKSRLFNRLAGDALALVDAAPDTTRDGMSTWLDLEGLPLELFDSPPGRLPEVDRWIVLCSPEHATPMHGSGILVWNKCDLADPPETLPQAIAISAERGTGIETLTGRLVAELRTQLDAPADRPVPVCAEQWALCAELWQWVESGAADSMLASSIEAYYEW